jgi:hypothetical protein
MLSGRLKMLLELQNQKNNVWGFNFVWIFKCSFIDLSTLEAFKMLSGQKIFKILGDGMY